MRIKGMVQALVSTCVFLVSSGLAYAHGVFIPNHHTVLSLLPLHHASTGLSSASLLSLLTKEHHSAAFNTAALLGGGPGSQATKNLNLIIKQLAESSINNSAVLSSLSSGQFVSTQFLGLGNVLSSDGLSLRAFGNNPYNGSAIPSVSINNLPPNMFVLGAPVKTGVTGKVIALNHGSAILPVSGALKAFNSFYGSIVRQGTALGRQLASTPTGGLLEGVYYQQSGNFFYPGLRIALAFGNNPFNSATVSTINFQPSASYIQLANNRTIWITNGQFYGTEYFQSGNMLFNDGKFFYSFGPTQYVLNPQAFPFNPNIPAFFI